MRRMRAGERRVAASDGDTIGRDEMECRGCGRTERASEGYPCARCGTFLCLLCEFRGVSECRACASAGPLPAIAEPLPPPLDLG